MQPSPHEHAPFRRTLFTRTHLGHLLHPGDTAVGYDVGNANLVDPELEKAVHKVWRNKQRWKGCLRCSCVDWCVGGLLVRLHWWAVRRLFFSGC